MKKHERIAVAIAALLLGVSFIAPLWNIEIWAPQYPEGLYMQIWTSKIEGDITTINILNHYIGMKAITPDSFPELQFFPKVFATLLVFGLLVAGIGKRWGLYLWTSTLLGFALWAFYDFWRWEHDFGHNLNPDAAIKVEGMTYAPPLIGSKELLNISAWSLPGLAGYAFGLAVALALLVSYLTIFKKSKLSTLVAALFGLSVLASACSQAQPVPIIFGKDGCEHCKMTITDRRFGAEIVTTKGKIYKYDSLECMLAHAKTLPAEDRRYYVLDAVHSDVLIPVSEASFVNLDPSVRSPMGKGILATRNRKDFEDSLGKMTLDRFLRWEQVLPVILNQ